MKTAENIDQNMVAVVNWVDYYQNNPELLAEEDEERAAHEFAKRFLAATKAFATHGFTEEDEILFDELENGRYRVKFSRELDL